MKLNSVIFLGLAAFITACAAKSSGDGATTSSSQSIIGGAVDQGDSSVVLVSAGDDTTGEGWWCTGSVIASRVVLTAAHCVEDATANTKFQIMFGTDVNAPSRVVDVVSYDHDPQYMATNNIAAGHDAAVLILSADANVTPLAINKTALTGSMVGQAVYVVGYGNDDGQAGTGAGTKRSVTTTLTALEQGVVDIGGTGQTTCQGDSGGPSFMTIGGANVIVGITSFGDEGCTSYGSSTRVDLSASWIQPFIDANGGGASTGASGGGSANGAAGSDSDAGSSASGSDSASCEYKCSDYGYAPGQCYQGWYCIPDGDYAGCLGQGACD